jgi:hypothetical protein
MPYDFAIVSPLRHVLADVRQGRPTHMMQKSSRTHRTGLRTKRGPRDAYLGRTCSAVCDPLSYPREPSVGSSVNAWRSLRAKIQPSSRRTARSAAMAPAAAEGDKRSARAIPRAGTAIRANRSL